MRVQFNTWWPIKGWICHRRSGRFRTQFFNKSLGKPLVLTLGPTAIQIGFLVHGIEKRWRERFASLSIKHDPGYGRAYGLCAQALAYHIWLYLLDDDVDEPM